MFDQQELQTLVGGTESPIDVHDLELNTVMPDGADDLTYRLFWKVVGTFNQDQLKSLLKFVTSCARPPLYVQVIQGLRAQMPNRPCSQPWVCKPHTQVRHQVGWGRYYQTSLGM
jgi:hypothetical protein